MLRLCLLKISYLAFLVLLGSLSLFSQGQFAKQLLSNESQTQATGTADIHLIEMHFQWDSLAIEWDTLRQHLYLRNPDLSIAQTTLQNYSLGGFLNSILCDNSYDANGNLIEYVCQTWTGFNWQMSDRNLYEFDSQNNRIMSLNLNWSVGSWDTTSGEQIIYTYDINQQATEVVYQNWIASQHNFTNIFRENNYFNANQEIDSVLYEAWNGSSWNPVNKIIGIHWHDFQLLQPSRFDYLEFSNGSFHNLLQYHNTYSNNNSYQRKILSWNSSSSSWDSLKLEIKSIDALDHEILSEVYSYNNGIWQLENGLQTLRNYDNQLNQLDAIELTSVGGSLYANSFKYEYGNFSVSRPEFTRSELELRVFPQPVGDFLNLDWEALGEMKIEVLDMAGNPVYQSTVRTGGQNFKIKADWPGGMYLLKMSIRGQVSFRKFWKN